MVQQTSMLSLLMLLHGAHGILQACFGNPGGNLLRSGSAYRDGTPPDIALGDPFWQVKPNEGFMRQFEHQVMERLEQTYPGRYADCCVMECCHSSNRRGRINKMPHMNIQCPGWDHQAHYRCDTGASLGRRLEIDIERPEDDPNFLGWDYPDEILEKLPEEMLVPPTPTRRLTLAQTIAPVYGVTIQDLQNAIFSRPGFKKVPGGPLGIYNGMLGLYSHWAYIWNWVFQYLVTYMHNVVQPMHTHGWHPTHPHAMRHIESAMASIGYFRPWPTFYNICMGYLHEYIDVLTNRRFQEVQAITSPRVSKTDVEPVTVPGGPQATYRHVGQGECRDVHGRYAIDLAMAMSYYSPHTAGNNAELARGRCLQDCARYRWCTAVTVVTRDIWPTPECYFQTNWPTLNRYRIILQGGYHWGASNVIDGQRFVTYIGGGVSNGGHAPVDPVRLYPRAGYNCYDFTRARRRKQQAQVTYIDEPVIQLKNPGGYCIDIGDAEETKMVCKSPLWDESNPPAWACNIVCGPAAVGDNNWAELWFTKTQLENVALMVQLERCLGKDPRQDPDSDENKDKTRDEIIAAILVGATNAGTWGKGALPIAERLMESLLKADMAGRRLEDELSGDALEHLEMFKALAAKADKELKGTISPEAYEELLEAEDAVFADPVPGDVDDVDEDDESYYPVTEDDGDYPVDEGDESE